MRMFHLNPFRVPFLTLLSACLCLIPSLNAHADDATYRRVDDSLLVPSLLSKIDPKAVVIPLDQVERIDNGKFRVRSSKRLPDVIYLETKARWLYKPKAAKRPPAGRLAVADVQGDVRVKLPSGQETAARPGMTLPSGARLTTGPGSTAAVSLAGSETVQLAPRSDAAIEHTQASRSTTRVNLSKGTVFADLAGSSPVDFQIKSPEGIAAAKGTEYLFSSTGSQSVACIIEGQIGVDNSSRKRVADLKPERSGDLQFQAIPPMTARKYAEWLNEMASEINDLNKSALSSRQGTSYTVLMPVVRSGGATKSMWEGSGDGRVKW